MIRIVLGAAFVLAFLPAPALAGCTPTGHVPEVDTSFVPGATYYVDNDLCQPYCAASVWVYEESNGISGLQREDFIHDATCGGRIPGDTIVAGAFVVGTGM